MKKTMYGLSLLAATALLGVVHAQPAPSTVTVFPAGVWATPDGYVVTIGPCADAPTRVCGIVTEHTPGPGEESAVGYMGLKRFVRDGDHWSGRSDDGRREYSATIVPRGEKLVLRSCLSWGLCAEEVWTRR